MRIQRLLGIYLMEFGRKNKTRAKKKEYNVVAFLGVFFFASQVSLLQSSIEIQNRSRKTSWELKKKKGNEETHK
jgi:hypothetical protein